MTICQSNNETKLQILNIKKSFGELLVLDDISLYLKQNEFVSLVGPSGSGKSTAFNIISGLIKPDEGRVNIDNVDYTCKTGRISYMYQKDLLLPWRRIIDNVSLPLIIKGMHKKVAREKAGEFFKIFGLNGFEHKYPFQLSGGMRQRAALLRTYLASEDIILLDEPFGGLDAITRSKMQSWLMEIAENLNTSILLITHDIEEAILLSDRIYVLSERPAKIKAEVCIDLPKQRNREMVTTVKFNEIKKSIYNIL